MNMTQCELVKAHLERYGCITSWDAITQYHVTRLSAVIYKLVHKYGMNIVAVPISEKRDGRVVNFTEYRLENCNA